MKSVYVIDPANSAFLDMVIEPLDSASVVAVFTLAFSTVVFCFLLGRGVGVVLSLIRRG
ncbi:hypothetical protein [Rhodoferax sp. WC2427]|uniref:hypothetical protein n=1 Tax=Rhodoferax sp. WC2427 TaxID=3234144 RepID=UPI0034657C76